MKINHVLVKRVKRKLKSVIGYPMTSIKAEKALNKLAQLKKDNELIIILTGAIGDSVYALAFLDAIKNQNKEKKIVVYGHSKWKDLLKSYTSIDRIEYIDSSDSDEIGDIKAIYGNNRVSEKGKELGIINGNAFYYKKCYSAANPDIMYQLRTYIYNVGESAPITYHGIREGMYPINETNFGQNDFRKTVILNPFSGSAFMANSEIYEEIAKLLNTRGYNVFTNVVGDQEPVLGTKPLSCSIYQLYDLCCKCPLIVSIRSGILDFVASSNINMFVIYENCSERIKKMYHLTNWECSGKIKELYPDNTHEEKEQILNDFNVFIKEVLE